MTRLLLILAAVLLAGCGGAQTPALTVGAVEDAAKWAPDADAPMRLAAADGLQAIVLSAVWHRGGRAGDDLPPLRRAVAAATSNDVRPVLAVYQTSSSTPSAAEDRRAFVAYAVALAHGLPDVREVIVGNEPNLNLFWMPQFDASGGDAAAAAYVRLLAETYDALKDEDADLEVVGGGLAPRGQDDPTAARATHSPTAFIRHMGAAYRRSGRTKPLMDSFDIHVYGESPRVPPTLRHPRTTSIGISDYPKLTRLVDRAFGGRLPIVYGEYGVETTIPPEKRRLYTGDEVVATVSEPTQARFSEQAVRLASHQPRVRSLFFFHVVDEVPLSGLQSALRYADGTPKSSLGPVRSLLRRR
jgi:hypothetical protein